MNTYFAYRMLFFFIILAEIEGFFPLFITDYQGNEM